MAYCHGSYGRHPTIAAQTTGAIPFARSCSLSTSAMLRISPLVPGPLGAGTGAGVGGGGGGGGGNFGERYHTVDGGRSYGIEHGSPVPSNRLPAGISRIKFVHLRHSTNQQNTTNVRSSLISRVRGHRCFSEHDPAANLYTSIRVLFAER